MTYLEPIDPIVVVAGDDGSILVSWEPAPRMTIGMALTVAEARKLANDLLRAAAEVAADHGDG